MPQQLPLPGFHPPDRPVEARIARTALAHYPDLDGATLSRYGKQLGASGELLFDSLMMRLGERVVPADEHEHFDRVLWLPDRFLRVQIKTRTVSSGAGYHFEIRKGYQRGPLGTKPYARADFDLLALVVLPESVIKFTAAWRPSHVVFAAEIPSLRRHPRGELRHRPAGARACRRCPGPGSGHDARHCRRLSFPPLQSTRPGA